MVRVIKDRDGNTQKSEESEGKEAKHNMCVSERKMGVTVKMQGREVVKVKYQAVPGLSHPNQWTEHNRGEDKSAGGWTERTRVLGVICDRRITAIMKG